ncbi:unnamed protein product, partial [Closterium sp. Naga37s-1]
RCGRTACQQTKWFCGSLLCNVSKHPLSSPLQVDRRLLRRLQTCWTCLKLRASVFLPPHKHQRGRGSDQNCRSREGLQ